MGLFFDFLLDVFRLEKGFEKRLETKSQCPENVSGRLVACVRPIGGHLTDGLKRPTGRPVSLSGRPVAVTPFILKKIPNNLTNFEDIKKYLIMKAHWQNADGIEMTWT